MDLLPISLCTLTLNEEANIARCIKSAPFVSEVVVVDSGSTDGTRDIAERIGARVIHEPFRGYVAQTAFAVSHATRPWVLQLDADEALSGDLRDEITRAFAAGDPPCDGFRMPRCTFFLDRWIKHSGWYPDWKLRLFRREKGRIAGEEPHPRGEVDGPLATLRQPILHRTYRGLGDHGRTLDRLARKAADARRLAGRHPSYLRAAVAPLFKAVRTYVLKRGFLDGRAGLLLAWYAAHYAFLKEAYLFEAAPGTPAVPGTPPATP